MPGMGKGSAASIAATLQCSFRRIKLALIVRICGGVPIRTDGEEILLGDVIISTEIVQDVFGRQLQDRFIRKHTLEDYLRQADPTQKPGLSCRS
jgi:nucleoside phosphorylase